MRNFKRILVPVDGSNTSNRAVQAAVDVARENGGVLLLVHAVDEMPHVAAFEGGPIFEAMRGAAERVVADSLKLAQDAGARAEALLIDKPLKRLGHAVAQAAEEWKADLVVVGTHGRRGFERLVLGSGAEQVIRCAPVPVLVIRGAEGD